LTENLVKYVHLAPFLLPRLGLALLMPQLEPLLLPRLGLAQLD